MYTIGTLILVLCMVALICAAFYCAWFCTREGDFVMAGGAALVGSAFLGMALLAAGEYRTDSTNPCVALGSPQTAYVMVGKILTPTTYTPCTQRQNEVAK